MKTSVMIKAWLSAARLRTLPLSISGIIVGSAYSYLYAFSSSEKTVLSQSVSGNRVLVITGLALLTTLGFQVLSNFANDYGDGVKGTDNSERVGPQRAVQSGIITAAQMKKAVIITAFLSFISAVLLILSSFSMKQFIPIILFMVLGVAAIWAAIKYTVGENAYGYSGLGDLFVFVFFGPVSVLGVFYLVTHTLLASLILPSITIGLLSVAVLNLNNMRDIVNDKVFGKNTIVVKIGIDRAKVFHYSITIIAIVAAIAIQGYIFFHTYFENEFLKGSLINLLFFLPSLAFIPLIIHLLKVRRTHNTTLLDPELKKVAVSTFFYAILTAISIFIIS